MPPLSPGAARLSMFDMMGVFAEFERAMIGDRATPASLGNRARSSARHMLDCDTEKAIGKALQVATGTVQRIKAEMAI